MPEKSTPIFRHGYQCLDVCASDGHQWAMWHMTERITPPKYYAQERACERCGGVEAIELSEDEYRGIVREKLIAAGFRDALIAQPQRTNTTSDFDQIAKRIWMLENERRRRIEDPNAHVPWRGVVGVETRNGADTILTLECGHQELWPDFGQPPTATLCTTCHPPRGEWPTLIDELRQVWNARGAADEDAVLAEFRGPTPECLRAAGAIRILDR
jgi:hypothetical protein